MGSCSSVQSRRLDAALRQVEHTGGESLESRIEYADSCMESGRRRKKDGDYASAIEWFCEALRIRTSIYNVPLSTVMSPPVHNLARRSTGSRDTLQLSRRREDGDDDEDNAALTLAASILLRSQKSFVATPQTQTIAPPPPALPQRPPTVTYHEDHVQVLMELAQTHALTRNADVEAFVFFYQVISLIDPLLVHLKRQKTTAIPHYVNATVGIVLLLLNLMIRGRPRHMEGGGGGGSPADTTTASSTQTRRSDGPSLWLYLGTYHPLDLAEAQLKRAIAVVEDGEGRRSELLVCLFHLQARVLLHRRHLREAQLTMQRCLGLTWSFGTTAIDAPALVAYSRHVLRYIKFEIAKDEAATRIQLWWRDRVVPRIELKRLASPKAVDRASTAGSDNGLATSEAGRALLGKLADSIADTRRQRRRPRRSSSTVAIPTPQPSAVIAADGSSGEYDDAEEQRGAAVLMAITSFDEAAPTTRTKKHVSVDAGFSWEIRPVSSEEHRRIDEMPSASDGEGRGDSSDDEERHVQFSAEPMLAAARFHLFDTPDEDMAAKQQQGQHNHLPSPSKHTGHPRTKTTRREVERLSRPRDSALIDAPFPLPEPTMHQFDVSVTRAGLAQHEALYSSSSVASQITPIKDATGTEQLPHFMPPDFLSALNSSMRKGEDPRDDAHPQRSSRRRKSPLERELELRTEGTYVKSFLGNPARLWALPDFEEQSNAD